MKEHLSPSDKSPAPQDDARMDHLVDSGVYNYAGARYQLGDEEVEVSPARRAQIKANHPSQGTSYRQYESRYDGEAFPVIDNSELSDEERTINRAAIAAIREANRVPYDQRTPQQHAMYRAEDERRSKNLK